MAVFGFFKKGFDPETFEKELNQLSESINSTSQQITKLQSRYKQIKRILIQWMVIMYTTFNMYYYMNIPSGITGKNQVVKYIKSLSTKNLTILLSYPIVSYLLVRLVRIIFNFLIRRRQSYLKSLKLKHKSKIEELKTITNYNKTKNLLNKYDEDESKKKEEELARNRVKQSPIANPKQVKNPMEQKIKQELNLDLDLKNLNEPQNLPGLNNQLQSKLKTNRSILEKVLDLLIGSDNNESIELRFALICHNCYAHNGLAPPGTVNPLYVKFQCYKCGIMNGNVDLQNTDFATFDKEEDSNQQNDDNIDSTKATEVTAEDSKRTDEDEKLIGKDVQENSIPKIEKETSPENI